MSRHEIVKLAKYGEECLQDSYNTPEIQDKLLSLAEQQFKFLLGLFKAQSIDPMVGYLFSLIGEVKYNQLAFLEAEKYYLEALVHLVVKGEYCQDRARTHAGLARSYMK